RLLPHFATRTVPPQLIYILRLVYHMRRATVLQVACRGARCIVHDHLQPGNYHAAMSGPRNWIFYLVWHSPEGPRVRKLSLPAFLLAAVLLVCGSAGPASASLLITIDKLSQQMTVTV